MKNELPEQRDFPKFALFLLRKVRRCAERFG